MPSLTQLFSLGSVIPWHDAKLIYQCEVLEREEPPVWSCFHENSRKPAARGSWTQSGNVISCLSFSILLATRARKRLLKGKKKEKKIKNKTISAQNLISLVIKSIIRTVKKPIFRIIYTFLLAVVYKIIHKKAELAACFKRNSVA